MLAGGVVKGYSAGGGAGGGGGGDVVKGYSAGGGAGGGGGDIVKGYSVGGGAGGVVKGYSAGGGGGIVKMCRRRKSRRCIRSISGESRMRWWCKHCCSTAHGADAVINRLRSAPPVPDRANINPPLNRREPAAIPANPPLTRR